MIKKLLLITGVLHSTYAWTDVRTDDETIQLECEETYWFQIDLVRNEHLAWKYDEPKTPLILKSIEIKPTEIKFVVNNEDSLINRKTGLLLRIDDVAENMSWKYMDKCEKQN